MMEFDNEKQRMDRLKSKYQIVIYTYDWEYVDTVRDIKAAKIAIKDYCKDQDILAPTIFELYAIPDYILINNGMAMRDQIDHIDVSGDRMVPISHSIGYIVTYYRSSYKRIDYLGNDEYGTR